eukprot:CAMPEP_0113245062 /NCGR_PEP_ID=MMETSP0008_2-20120614/8736_1 /TAXON_ID=97485 /ORGANISM="Prymnesium parvum" /LENGTH=97 /DNA_ID=CAMNT_0000092725 /DNA_START=1060 /DNA_END=1350 /DNA_ORIENTATION=+ /assembly_acc=CAM_ASM_000153
MSASIALIVGSASAACSFALEQQSAPMFDSPRGVAQPSSLGPSLLGKAPAWRRSPFALEVRPVADQETGAPRGSSGGAQKGVGKEKVSFARCCRQRA